MPDHELKGTLRTGSTCLRSQVTVWNTAPPVMTMLLDLVAASSEAWERFSTYFTSYYCQAILSSQWHQLSGETIDQGPVNYFFRWCY